MTATPARTARIAAITLAVCGLWAIASVPWGLPVWHVLPFAAPGALLGLATGWMAHAATRWTWTWSAARRSALAGALVLAPLLVFYIGIEGNLRAERLIVGFVRAAWMALGVGAAWAGLLWIRRVRRSRAAAKQHTSGKSGRSSRAA